MMNKDDHFDEHLKLCQAMYERMKRDSTWPWLDSLESQDVIESDNTSDIA